MRSRADRRSVARGTTAATLLLAALGASSCATPTVGPSPAPRERAPASPRPAQPPGLWVSGNRLLTPEGSPFQGRGVNLHDTRSCNSCVTRPPNPAGLKRWIDELVADWHVTFVRFLLSAWPSDDGYRVQYRRLVDDADYARDVRDVVTHLTDKGVYVLVTVFADPSVLPDGPHPESEWPSPDTSPVYALLAEMFHGHPRVLFGLGNEPHGPPARNADLARRYLSAIDVIREVERSRGVEPHVVVVPAPQGYARDVSYFVEHPLPRPQIAYEIHPYSHATELERLVAGPARTLPLIIGEYGPTPDMTPADVEALWLLADGLALPHLAWNFHGRCGPTMIEEDADDACGLSRDPQRPFARTAWGHQVWTYLNGAQRR